MIRILIFLLILTGFKAAHASEIERAFRAKRHDVIAMRYRAQPKRKYTPREQLMISASLRKMRFYRDDIKLNVRLINEKFRQQHRSLLISIKNKKSIDGDKFKPIHKNLYWNIYSNYAELIKGYSKHTKALDKDHKHFKAFQKILSELEYKEGEADRLSDRIAAHLTYLNDSIYRFSSSWTVKYISWQRGAVLTDLLDGTTTRLILTNRGNCLGGDVGVENNFYHFYMDGCLLLGAGGVSSYGTPDLTYRQANVPAFGLKLGPGASLIVSSTKARIGFRMPFIYTLQQLTQPNSPGYKLSAGGVFGLFGALYSRWHFNQWYFDTEFGKNILNEDNYWSLGLGRTF